MSLKNLQDDASHLGLTPEEFSRIFTPMPGYGKFNVGRYAKHAEDAMVVHNSLGTCIVYTLFGTDVIHVEKLTDLYSACTGIRITPQELKHCGERIFTLYKLLNVREGWTFRDRISRIWLTPRVTPDGPKPLKDYYQEHELTSSTVEQLLDEYYAERGWDSNGIPTQEKLQDLDLGEFSI
jgi:aldehyde:ferredoxin oxidoreductase